MTEPTGSVPDPAGQPAGHEAAEQEPAGQPAGEDAAHQVPVDGDASPAGDQKPAAVSEATGEDRRKPGVDYKPV